MMMSVCDSCKQGRPEYRVEATVDGRPESVVYRFYECLCCLPVRLNRLFPCFLDTDRVTLRIEVVPINNNNN